MGMKHNADSRGRKGPKLHRKPAESEAEKTLRASEERLALAVSASRAMVYDMDPQTGRILAIREADALVGCQPRAEEMSVQWWDARIHPDDLPICHATFKSTLRHPGQHRLEYRVRHEDGRWLHVEDYATVVCDDSGKPVRIVGTVVNITDQKRALQNEERFATLLNHNPSLLFLKDEEGKYVYLNPAYEKKFALTSDWIGKTDFDFWSKESAEMFRQNDAKVLISGEISQFLEDSFDLNGNRHCWLCYKFPFTDSNGRRYVGGIGIESTARVLAEEALRENEEKYRSLFENMSEMFQILEPIVGDNGKVTDFRYIEINKASEILTGKNRKEIEGKTAKEIWGIVEDHWLEMLEQVLKTGEPVHMENYSRELDAYYDLHAWKANGRKVAIVFSNVTERKRSEAALAVAKAAAETANAAKSQFLANMSHELRTPMNAILGMIEVALPNALNPLVQDCLKTAKDSADLLLTLLNDFLDSAKIDAGKLELEAVPFDLRQLLETVKNTLSFRAHEKGLGFSCNLPDDAPETVVGDRHRLQQVLVNLAGNAIKFTDCGEVEIVLRSSSQDKEAHLEFSVRDTGIGISPSNLEHLFQPFSQADASMSRRFGGSGLGLSLSKNLIEMMNGRIWVESRLGEGSTFHFTVQLPIAKKDPAATRSIDALLPPAPKPLRILLAEDNRANQKLATYILNQRGHTVEIADNGRQALELFRKNQYDALLMDIQMPEMDGLEATKSIRLDEAGKRWVPIIAMTAHAMNEDRDRCVKAGMDAYLSKPINAKEMINLLETLVSSREPHAARSKRKPERKK
jgi:PAS domain S-box-containing protein